MFNIFLTKIGILQTPRVYKDLQVKARPAFQTAGISMNGQVAKRVRCGFQPHKSPLTTCFERNDFLHLSSATFCSLLSLLRYTSLRLQLIPTPLCNIGGKGRKKRVPKSTFWQTYPIVQLPVRAPPSLVRNNSPILFPLISFQVPVVMDAIAMLFPHVHS